MQGPKAGQITALGIASTLDRPADCSLFCATIIPVCRGGQGRRLEPASGLSRRPGPPVSTDSEAVKEIASCLEGDFPIRGSLGDRLTGNRNCDRIPEGAGSARCCLGLFGREMESIHGTKKLL